MPRKATAILPPTEVLHEFFVYEPKTGVLIWRRRTVHHFGSLRACESWNGHYADKPVGWLNANGYLATRIGKTSFLVQRIIWKLMTGLEPPEQIDHIDGDRINNRWKNLRPANENEQCWNRKTHSNNKLGLKGVSKRRNSYIARICHKGTYTYLGQFSTPELASAAYERTAKELYGKFYRKLKLNL